ncbi:transcription termination factor Rho [Bifidobacterium jacchi]|uniref:Transcription termination factor Rho n=1 Tax=Bifidobacterium jacchi TaxID=2490545 RepID=A0A5N5RKM5_9BIFI|nr:transcription termination factor Rho [Bifidobacterium jacchi]KAB5607844.1 transcription termination factor Rho [Bifidobacterium jacchi]
MANSQNLEDMKLPELKELAKQMGLRGTSTMRKPELLATLQAARSGGQAPAGVTVRPLKASSANAQAGANSASANAGTANSTNASGGKPTEAAQSAPVSSQSFSQSPVTIGGEDGFHTVKPAESDQQQGRTANRTAERVPLRKRRRTDDGSDLLSELNLPQMPGRTDNAQNSDRNGEDAQAERADRADRADRRPRHRGFQPIDDEPLPRRRRRATAETRDDSEVRDLDDILAALPNQHADTDDSNSDGETQDREFSRRARSRADRGDRSDRADRTERRPRRLRGRDRDYDNDDSRRDDLRADRDRDDHADRTERTDRTERPMRDVRDRDARRDEQQDDLVPVAGIVDVLESYAFVRTSGYLPGPNDVYVSMGQVKKYGLRKGDAVHGTIRPPRDGDRRNQRQKFVPLQSIDSINGMSVEDAANRPQFAKLTPLYPQERLKQETTPNKLTGRIMDIVSPIGKGQRGLIVSPPKAGKTMTLQNIANSIATNNPEVHLMVVLVDERPEEVTDMERTVQGEVISSTFDRPATDHTTVAELAIERAKRLVELGQDVVVLLDSMTRLARAYNIAAPASGRILSGGVDAQALYPPKKFFGAARNIENGGSLTIISSALVETGSKMDEVIFEEFKGTGNMELRLSRELADKRLFPAIDINASGTRREELITKPDELPIIYRLRRLLGGMEPEQAYQTLVPRLKKAPTNRDFLAAIVQQSNSNAVNGN